VGQFSKAVEVAQGALRLASEHGSRALGAALEKEIKFYQAYMLIVRHPSSLESARLGFAPMLIFDVR